MRDDLAQRVQRKVAEVLLAARDIRHKLHACPELADREHQTRRLIAEALAETALDVWQPLLGTDFIGELTGGAGGPGILLRADIDALPIAEAADRPYASGNPGRMHACGHDGHTAMLIAAAWVLDSLRDELPGNVRFVFQPGEELAASGAKLVEAGCCRGVQAAYAIHGWPGLPAGCVSTRPGPLTAAAAFLAATFRGKGCHGSQPASGINPIPIAAAAVAKLKRLHDRVNAADGSVVSVCLFRAGANDNIIPDTAEIRGTVRYLRKARGRQLERSIRRAVEAAARGTGASVELGLDYSYPLPVDNDAESAERIARLAERYLPAGGWHPSERPKMIGEDFAFYLDELKCGAMFLLGLGADSPPLHGSAFDFNDEALENGIRMLCLLALDS